MLDFTFSAPTRFVFGKGAEQQAGTLCKSFGAHKVLIVSGGSSARKSGLLGRVTDSLDGAGLPWLVLEGIRANPADGPVYEGIRLARAEGADFLLAVGGGSVIDTAKAVALGAVRDGDFWDCYSGAAACTEALPVGVVLTIPASGSEGCGSSVITKDGLKRSATADALIPKFSVMNPELTYTLPAYQTACGCVDMLSHCCERYFTKTPDADLTGRLGEAIMACIVKYAPIALAEPDNYEARANLMWCGTLAHNNLTASGRQPDFACHRMEHELSALYNVAHGAGLAVVTPAWMKYVYKDDPLLFAHWGQVLFGLEIDYRDPARTAWQAIACLEGFYRSLGMPATFADIGARAEDIPLMAKKCQRNNGEFCGFFRPLAEEDLIRIYEMML